MPEIKPFCGILYNQAAVTIADVVAPPYDVISSQQREELYAASPYNIVRLDFGKEEDRYASAAAAFAAWRSAGILLQDETPAIYAMVQEFSTPAGKRLRRHGFIALCRLEAIGAGSILPHEKTLPEPKEDRFRLLQATRATFSQIFCIYNDAERKVDNLLRRHLRKSAPAIDTVFDGVQHRVWKITDAETIASIQHLMSRQRVLIADGHHRYETALAFQRTMIETNPAHSGDEPYNYTMMYFTNLHDPGLSILPTHRLVHSVPAFDSRNFLRQLSLYFRVEKQVNFDEMLSELRRRRQHAFGLVLADEPRYHLFSLMHDHHLRSILPSSVPSVLRNLDVTLLHGVVFEKILGIDPDVTRQKSHLVYIRDERQAEGAVSRGDAQAAFLINPPSIEQIRAVAEAGKTMPQKSTYFYPKLCSGIVIHSLGV